MWDLVQYGAIKTCRAFFPPHLQVLYFHEHWP